MTNPTPTYVKEAAKSVMKVIEDCPTCDGKKQVPVTPPASTESKSLGDIYDAAVYDENRGASALSGPGYDLKDHLRGLQAVEAAVSLRCKGEVEELKELLHLERCRNFSIACNALNQEVVRLTILANETRKDAVIEEAKASIQAALNSFPDSGAFLTVEDVRNADNSKFELNAALARLAQKGKS